MPSREFKPKWVDSTIKSYQVSQVQFESATITLIINTHLFILLVVNDVSDDSEAPMVILSISRTFRLSLPNVLIRVELHMYEFIGRLCVCVYQHLHLYYI